MNKPANLQLEFFVKLTQIIGRTFNDLQQLLAAQLKRQQSNCQVNQHRHQNITIHTTQILPRLIQARNQQGKVREAEESNSGSQNIKNSYVPKTRKAKIIKKNNIQQKQTLKKRKQKTNKKVSLDGRPMPPLNAFMLYLQTNKQNIMKKRPDLSPSQVSTFASTIWNSLSQNDKQEYKAIYRQNHEKYLEQMRKFKSKEGTHSQDKKEQDNNKFKLHLRPNRRLRRLIRPSDNLQVICLEQSDAQQTNKHTNKQDQN